MKLKNIILVIIAILLVFSLSVKTFAIDDPVNPGENENPGTGENTGNENEDPVNPGENENPGTGENTNTGDQTGTETNEPYYEPTNNPETYETSQSSYTYSSPRSGAVSLQKSENADLKSLSIDIEGMTPNFDKTVTDYYLTVELDVEEINVSAVADDSSATVAVSGNTNLKEGENIINIIVTAEDGSTKTYVIHVTKTDDIEATNANLKSLEVIRFEIYPTFKSDVYNYSIIIDEKISKLEILAETENENAKYVIEGNEDLKEGSNLIKIIVTAANGETIKEYKINVFISTGNSEGLRESRMEGFTILGILGAAILITIIAMIKKK